jgi:hypothetical protein
MNIQHLNLKLFLEDSSAVDLEQFIGVFNGWIQRQTSQERVTDELLIDVADYRHVFAGPGLLLIGHEANYSLDNTGNRLGLLYNRKAKVDGSVQERLAQAARALLLAAQRLETENGLKFNAQELLLIVNDRLLAPNTEATFTALAPELQTFFDRLYAGAGCAIDWAPDSRERFTVNVTTTANVDVAALLRNLEREPIHA